MNREQYDTERAAQAAHTQRVQRVEDILCAVLIGCVVLVCIIYFLGL